MFTESDPQYPTILPPGFAVWLVFVVNIFAFGAAFLASRNMPRLKWLPHVIAFVWLAYSPSLAAILALPTIPADESPGPGDGFILLPVIGEVAVCLLGYVSVSAALTFSKVSLLVKYFLESR